jgi:DnaJ homolog subfamily C member 19
MIKFLLFVGLLGLLYVVAKRTLAAPKPMGKAEAAKLLGIASDADTETILDAHRRLITKVHPDAGGNAELASRINQARDILLKP